MTLLDLIAEMNRLDFKITSIEEKKFHFQAPKGYVPSPSLILCIKRHRHALLDMLEQKKALQQITEKVTK